MVRLRAGVFVLEEAEVGLRAAVLVLEEAVVGLRAAVLVLEEAVVVRRRVVDVLFFPAVLFLTGMEPPFTIRTHHDDDRILYPAAEISYPALPGSIEHQDRAGDGPSLHRAERPVGAGDESRTRDPLLGKHRGLRRHRAILLRVMGNFDSDTRVTGSSGRYEAKLSEDWRVWGPAGGYVAAIALRAAGMEAQIKRPASFSGHFLRVGDFREVDLEVAPLHAGRRSESIHVVMRQDGRPLFQGILRTAVEAEGLEHNEAEMPVMPEPAGLKTWPEILPLDVAERGPH